MITAERTFNESISPIAKRGLRGSGRFRRRRVRLGYPAAFVELALVMSDRLGTRQAAAMLDLNLSTMYRWMGQHRNIWAPRYLSFNGEQNSPTSEVIASLCSRCEKAGYPLRLNGVRSQTESAVESAKRNSLAETRQFATPIAQVIIKLGGANQREKIACDLMLGAKRAIDSNYMKKLSCTALGASVDLSKTQFIKAFSAAFGLPPYQYLIGIRVQHALAILESSGPTLREVAGATGFGSVASMQRAFRRFLGASPAKTVNAIYSEKNRLLRDSYLQRKLINSSLPTLSAAQELTPHRRAPSPSENHLSNGAEP
jgi:AraC family transcriptional regulator